MLSRIKPKYLFSFTKSIRVLLIERLSELKSILLYLHFVVKIIALVLGTLSYKM